MIGFRCSAWQDHPRSRGVYKTFIVLFLSVPGSSPLARGLRLLKALEFVVVRIIPARAGFTRAHGCRGSVWSGSSPLARGLPRISPRLRSQIRIIPARAGCTPKWAKQPRNPPDHPRSRGVYADLGQSDPYPGGSSPLARGLRDECFQQAAKKRIIPARAGFT